MVVANQKGGVGKTTTAVNVAAALAQHGLRVLIVDLDPQGNASTALSIEHAEGTPGAYQVLVDSTPIADVVVECPQVPGLDVVPATIDLAGAEIELVSLVARETRLRKSLDAYLADAGSCGERRYDYVFIDCPPSLGLLTVNALAAGREMLIPIQCEYYALEGLSQLLRTIEQIKEHLNPELRLGAIMLTMFDARTRLAAGVADEVRAHFGDQVLASAIPRSVRISEAPSYGQTVLTYDPGSVGALAYLEAAAELTYQQEKSRMSTQRRGLGRGLGSLIPSAPRPTSDRGAVDEREPGGDRATEIGAYFADVPGWLDHAQPPPAAHASSTRRRWPSWSTRSARSACCSRSWSGRSGDGPVRADHGRAALARLPAGRARHRSRPSSARPPTTPCSATRCWRTCIGPS